MWQFWLYSVNLSVSKKITFFKNQEDARQLLLEESLKRTPEERILWLLQQIELMNSMNPVKKKPRGFILPKKHG